MKRALSISAFFLILVLLLSVLWLLPSHWLQHTFLWIQAHKITGSVLFLLLAVLANVMMVPASILTIGASFLFGPLVGWLLIYPANVLGAALAFFISRHLFRALLRQRLARSPRFWLLDQALGKKGTKLVFLLRLSPIFPFHILNYILGATAVSFASFVWATALGILPSTFLYLYLGSLVKDIYHLDNWSAFSQNLWLRLFYLAGFVATLALFWWVTRVAKEALGDALKENVQASKKSEHSQ